MPMQNVLDIKIKRNNMHALISLHAPNFQPLADLTWDQNKLLYAQRHGYSAFCKSDNLRPNSIIGYQKIHYVKEILEQNKDIDWVWCTGTDSMITNFATKIEDRIDNNYHFIVSTDVNGINADSFLVRNTPEGHGFINHLIELEEECSKHWDGEQRAIAVALGLPVTGDTSWKIHPEPALNERYQNIAKIMPQRFMNSFHYRLYHYTDLRDKLGVHGDWEQGDWLIHWPATPLDFRIQLFNHFKQFILY